MNAFMHAALVLHLHLQVSRQTFHGLDCHFSVSGEVLQRGIFFSFFFFQSNFYVMGTKVVSTIHDHYTEFSYCMVKVLQNQRGTCV